MQYIIELAKRLPKIPAICLLAIGIFYRIKTPLVLWLGTKLLWLYDPQITVQCIFLLLISNLFFFSLYMKYRPKYKLRFAVKWDKKGNPYCPTSSCESPMYEFSHNNEGSTISCPICEKSNIQLKHEDGRYIFIEEARLMIAKHLKLDEIRNK